VLADPTQTRVAWIGLGAMGTPMALNLLQAGYRVTVFNRDPKRCQPLVQAGANQASSPAAAAAQANVLVACVSDDAAVEAVLLGDPQPDAPSDRPGPKTAAIHGLRPGSLVIDCSSISPGTSRRMATALAEREIAYIDAPVTGGTEGACAGRLAVLVGGDAEQLERAKPLLAVVGASIHHFGPVGSGQEAKAVNQVLVAGSYAAVAEALSLAERLGLDRNQVVAALNGGAAGSWALTHRSERMINDHYPLGFRLSLHRKDLSIALEAAAERQLHLPLSQLVASMEDDLMSAGHGELDVSVLARWFTR